MYSGLLLWLSYFVPHSGRNGFLDLGNLIGFWIVVTFVRLTWRSVEFHLVPSWSESFCLCRNLGLDLKMSGSTFIFVYACLCSNVLCPVYVHILTPTRRAVLYDLRQMKRAHPNIVMECSNFDGKAFAYTKPQTYSPNAQNVRYLINSREKLQLFCRRFIKKPLDVFVNSWPTDS